MLPSECTQGSSQRTTGTAGAFCAGDLTMNLALGTTCHLSHSAQGAAREATGEGRLGWVFRLEGKQVPSPH